MAMASSDFPDSADPDIDECLDQICYVLHAAPPPPPRQAGRPPRAANADLTHANTLPPCLPDEPPLCGLWRYNAFHVVWGRLETLIQVTLEEQNDASFKEIRQWVCNRQFFEAQQQLYRSARVASLDALQTDSSTYGAHIVGSFNKKLHAALLFLGGADPSDHQNTFDGLSMYLKSQNCHVARLVASDFPSKCQVAVPLYSLLRQFLQIQPETADMEILAAWYSETRNHGHPVVIIVEHMERCSVTALAELIILLSEWSAEIPVVLILGVATTADVLQRFLPSNALSRLVPCAFTLKSPLERLESVVRAVLVDSFCAFEVSHMVFKHLHMHFFRHDLTVTSFIMSLKVACMEHFCSEPLSFVSQWLLRSSSQVDLEKQCAALPVEFLEYAARLPSAESADVDLENMRNQIASGLWRFREQKQLWTVALLCLVEVGKQVGVGFIELFGQALCPAKRQLESADELNSAQQPSNRVLSSGWLSLVTKLREQTPSVLKSILEEWKRLTSAVNELHADVCAVYTTFLSRDSLNLQSTSSGRLETMASAPISPSCTNHLDTTRSPLSRPSSESLIKQTSPGDLHCRPMKCTPEGAQMASPQGLRTLDSTARKCTRKGDRDHGWTDKETSVLVKCKLLAFHDRGSPFRKQESNATEWEAISEELKNNPDTSASEKTGAQCRRRWKTLVKSYSIIKEHCMQTEKEYAELIEEISDLKLAAKLKKEWYEVIDAISLKTSSQQRDSPRGVGDFTNHEGGVGYGADLVTKSSGTSCLNQIPRPSPSKLTPAKRLISDSGLLDSASGASLRLPKSPKTGGPSSINAHESPRRPSTRSLAPDLNAAAVVINGESPKKLLRSPAKSPCKPPKSPAESPRKPPKSPAKSPRKLLKSPAKTSSEVSLGQSPRRTLLKSPENKSIESEGRQSQQAMGRSELRRLASQHSVGVVRVRDHPLNELVADLFQRIILHYLVPTEDLPLHEIICFRNVSSLQQAMTGATRQKVQLDLLGSQLRLQCECCHPDGSLSNSMHDTCLAYHLSQEHNELINVHDWYQSFSSICYPAKASAGKKGKGKKSEGSVVDPVTLQARFTRAATELQIAGLLRMPKKGRPDFAQRVCLN